VKGVEYGEPIGFGGGDGENGLIPEGISSRFAGEGVCGLGVVRSIRRQVFPEGKWGRVGGIRDMLGVLALCADDDCCSLVWSGNNAAD
jgi:hypothetical protein